MPQLGIHALAGSSLKKWVPKKENLMFGIVLGTILPDADAVVVAYATLAGKDTHGLHRTYSHSIFTMIALVLVFYIIAKVTARPTTANLGLGIGIGMLSHALIDIFLWFRGLEILWPFYGEISIWGDYTPPDWWFNKFEMALEFGMIAVFFLWLGKTAQKLNTNQDYLAALKKWTWVEIILFAVFTVLVYTWEGFFIVFGAVYILTLALAFTVMFKMKDTIEAMAGN